MANTRGFSERIHERMLALGYVKRDKPDIARFCRERDYRPQYIYAWLKGRLPRSGHLERLAGDLGVSPAWLMFGEQEMPLALTGSVAGQVTGRPSARLGPSRPRATLPGGHPQGSPHRTPPSPLRVLDFGRLRELTEQLSQVQAQLEGVFRAFPDRYLWLDADGTVLSCNGPEDHGAVAGRSLSEVFPPEPAGHLNQAFLRTLRTNSLTTLEYAAHEAGEARLFEARFVPLGGASSRRRQVLLIIRDITERKRLEEQLRERDRDYVSLLGNVSGMAYRCRNDERWTMELVSDGCHALTGYGASDLSGNRVVAFADLIHREDRQRVWEQCQASLEARQPCSSEYRIVTAGGEEKWVWDQARGVYAPSGELLAVDGLVTDITQRKRAEEIAAALEAVGRRMVGPSTWPRRRTSSRPPCSRCSGSAARCCSGSTPRPASYTAWPRRERTMRCSGSAGRSRQARGRRGGPWPSDDPWHRRTS